jgi:L-seryl-tRNA(Ser) seleniumtransferase
LYRAFRVDKLTIQVLESTFRHLWSGQFHLIPSLRFISTPLEELERRIRAVRENAGTGAVEAGESLLGGGSTPDQSLRTWLLTFSTAPERLERQLRENEPPIIARIERGKLLIDLRSVEPSDDECVANALRRYARST